MKLRQLINGGFKGIKGISCNASVCKRNFVFVAIKGTKADGHSFILEALRRGATVVVVDSKYHIKEPPKGVVFIRAEDTRQALAQLSAAFYKEPSKKLGVIGITGTNGKTTISYLIEAICKEAGLSCGVIGTVNYRFNQRVIVSKNTTPGPVELQRLLAKMYKENVSHVAMEVSSHALDQERTEGIYFSSAIFTNLTQDHLDYHKTMLKYFQAKEKLFTRLPARTSAFLNVDDPYGCKLKSSSKGRVITYAIKRKADVTAKDIVSGSSCTSFTVETKKVSFPIKSALIGRHNIYNILAAAAWALRHGISFKIITAALLKFKNVPGRLQCIPTGKDFSVFVDYAHTDDALCNVIGALRELGSGRIITVFGCGGERDKTKRPKMGRAATMLSDYCIITSDNPRSENQDSIVQDILKGVEKTNYCVVSDRAKAIQKAISLAQRKDIILIAGKGHEQYQILNTGRVPFNDCEVARKCFA